MEQEEDEWRWGEKRSRTTTRRRRKKRSFERAWKGEFGEHEQKKTRKIDGRGVANGSRDESGKRRVIRRVR